LPGPAFQPFTPITRVISVRTCASVRHVVVYRSLQPLAGKAWVSTNDPPNVELYAAFPVASVYCESLQ
jgi:hypothetical protein